MLFVSLSNKTNYAFVEPFPLLPTFSIWHICTSRIVNSITKWSTFQLETKYKWCMNKYQIFVDLVKRIKLQQCFEKHKISLIIEKQFSPTKCGLDCQYGITYCPIKWVSFAFRAICSLHHWINGPLI